MKYIKWVSFPPTPTKGNRCKLFDSPSTCSSTILSTLKRTDRSQEESPRGNRKRRKSVAGASPEEAASPKKPQEVSYAGSFLLKDCDIVSFSSKMFIWFFFFAETCCSCFSFVSIMFIIACWSIFIMATLKSLPGNSNVCFWCGFLLIVVSYSSWDFPGSWYDKWFFNYIYILWVLWGYVTLLF